MLEQYFLKPDTVAQSRSSWLGEPIKRYVKWLSSQGYPPGYIRSRVPILRQLAQFTWSRGVTTFADLPEQVEPFVAHRMAGREAGRSAERIRRLRDAIRGPVEHLVALLVVSFVKRGRARITRDPFLSEVPGFFTYLREERGLREATTRHYGYYLRVFEAYLTRIGVQHEGLPRMLHKSLAKGLTRPMNTGLFGPIGTCASYSQRVTMTYTPHGRVLRHCAHREGPCIRSTSR